MPWKVKKMRRIGPFWFESSKASKSAEVVDLRAATRHRAERPLFGEGRDTSNDGTPRPTGTHGSHP
jgi:hypothetical protein